MVTPGRIALTLILYLPSSIAAVFVKLMVAALLTAYGDRQGKPKTPAVEEMLMIEPPLFFLSIGIAFLVNKK